MSERAFNLDGEPFELPSPRAHRFKDKAAPPGCACGSTAQQPRANDGREVVSPLIDERQLCADLNISSVTATKWRANASGPPFIKVGRLVRYRRADVEAWLVSRTVGRDPRV